jgi:hypothetical protein
MNRAPDQLAAPSWMSRQQREATPPDGETLRTLIKKYQANGAAS